MRERRSSPAPSETTLANKDQSIRSALLINLLALYPAQLTITELIQEMAADPGDFGEHDDIERAVGDLASVGLLLRHGPFVVPSRAAVCASTLLEML